jgi:hypothetical protein
MKIWNYDIKKAHIHPIIVNIPASIFSFIFVVLNQPIGLVWVEKVN